MCIENKFRSYLAAWDGTQKDFSTVEYLFDELYGAGFEFEDHGCTVDREWMKQTHAKAFELGSKATLLNFSASSSTVEFEFRLTNDEWDIMIENIATVKDNELIRAQRVDGTKPIFLINFLAYVAAFDGTPKEFSEVAHLFDEVYDNDYIYRADGKLFNKEQVKQIEGNALELGSKATLLFLEHSGSDILEYEFRIVNDKFDHVVHNIGKMKGNKLVSSGPIDQVSLESVSNALEVFDAYDRAKVFASTIEVKSFSENDGENVAVSQ